MARDAKKHKKGFYRYLKQKRKVQEGVTPPVTDTGRLVTTDKEKAEEGIRSSIPPTLSEDQVCDQLVNLNILKSMGPKEMHPRV